MHKTRQSEPIHQSRNVIEQLPTIQRPPLEHLFEGSTALKQENRDPKRRDAYVSDIINVQSLLNIPAARSQRYKRYSSASLRDRIIINVSGDRYETHRTTLELYPDTLLGNRKRRQYYYDKTRNEYFFDRNRACFQAILYYYQSNGRLRRPSYIPIDVFLEEITFFQLGTKALNEIRLVENIQEVKKVLLPKNRFRRHLWATMEYPEYSIIAKMINILSLLMILISTISLAVESLPQYTNIVDLACHKVNDVLNDTSAVNSNYTNITKTIASGDIYCQAYFTSPFFIIQTVCVAFFTIELLLRIMSAPSLFDFIKSIMNWIDILAIIPYYIALGIRLAGQQNQIQGWTSIGLRLLRIIRLARVFKFYRVFKSVKSLRVLASTFKQSIPDFLIMIVTLTLLSFLFGAAAYFAENDTNGQAYDSILKATYWGIMTITSVGYGDISPITPIGRVIACVCALFGAATIGMLVSVLVDRYQRVFARKLYVNEEPIDFHDYSDDENHDTDSRISGQLHNESKIEDPDARARVNAAFEDDIMENSPIVIENPLSRQSSRVHFIIGYVNDDNNETSRDIIEQISSIVAEKQTAGDNIRLSIISDEQQREASSFDVKFEISSSYSEEGMNDDDEEELTEIISGCGNKGNVLKKFQRPPSPNNNK